MCVTENLKCDYFACFCSAKQYALNVIFGFIKVKHKLDKISVGWALALFGGLLEKNRELG